MKSSAIEHIWSILCSSYSVDSTTNNASLFNIIEKINISVAKEELANAQRAGGVGVVPMAYTVVSRLRRNDLHSPTQFSYRVQVLDGSGRELASTERMVEAKGQARYMRISSTLNGFPISQSGEYTVVIQIQESADQEYIDLGTVPFEVEVTPVG